MRPLSIGQYVTIISTGATQGMTGVIVGYEDGLMSYRYIVMFSDNKKMNYKPESVKPINAKCKVVLYRNAEYLVTPKLNIISRTTGRIMKWSETDGNRVAILAAAAAM